MTAAINTGTVIDTIATELGDELNERRTPSWSGALMATAGAAIGGGGLAMAADDAIDDGSRTLPLVASIALVVVAYAVLVLGRDAMKPGGIAMLSIGLAGFSLLVLPVDTGGGAIRGLIMAVVFIAAWMAPPSRGRPWLLGLGLVGLWVALIDVVQDDPLDTVFGLGGAEATTTGVVSVLFGLASLGTMFLLDKRGAHGALATPFAAVGNLAYVVGASAVASDITSAAGAGTVVLVGGAILAWLGARGRHRRMTTWLGAIGVFIGLLTYVAAIYDGDSLVVAGGIMVMFGVMLAAVAFFLADYTAFKSGEPEVAAAQAVAADSAAIVPQESGPAVDPSLPVAGWYADPGGRYPHRYWDGTAWTTRVRTADGTEGTDPVG